jgi:hypothetical protein
MLEIPRQKPGFYSESDIEFIQILQSVSCMQCYEDVSERETDPALSSEWCEDI